MHEQQNPSSVDLELFAKVEGAPVGTYRLFHARDVGTEERIHTHLRNLDELGSRVRNAEESGCFIEVISLRLQVIDFWLRIYFSDHAPQNQRRGREFGRLLDQCLELGFASDLYARASAFNLQRIKAIHGYVIGHTTYDSLRDIAAASWDLTRDIIVFVISNSGTTVRNRSELCASPGAMVIHVDGFCRDIMSRIRKY